MTHNLQNSYFQNNSSKQVQKKDPNCGTPHVPYIFSNTVGVTTNLVTSNNYETLIRNTNTL